jgi:hypothetical protein
MANKGALLKEFEKADRNRTGILLKKICFQLNNLFCYVRSFTFDSLV